MARRPAIRKTDIDVAAASLIAHGLKPKAVDFLPSGRIRFYFEDPSSDDDNEELDRELAEFEANHGES